MIDTHIPYQTQYYGILKRLINNPNKIGDSRIGKINSRFCEQLRINLQKEFPLQELKKIKPSNIIHELIWMLRGDTNIKYLIENNCNIWTDDAYRYYKEKYAIFHNENKVEMRWNDDELFYLTKEEFIEKVKNDEFIEVPTINRNTSLVRYYYGDLDKIYGKQWRSFGQLNVDQINKCINTLMNNPDDRRMIVTGHNPSDIEDNNVGLPSCHNYMQFYTTLDENNNRKLSLFVNIRSNDWFLGQPYNAAQYGLLTHIIANLVGMEVNELVINAVDAHLYHAHFDAANKWIERYENILDDNYVGEQGTSYDLFELFGCNSKIEIINLDNIDDISINNININDYTSDSFIKAPLLT